MFMLYINHGYAVYSAYIRPENRGQRKFEAYALQTSDDRDLRVVYMRNTPSNHDSYNIYASRRRHKLETGTKDGKTWRILYIKIAGT